jgi:hypothetical protein
VGIMKWDDRWAFIYGFSLVCYNCSYLSLFSFSYTIIVFLIYTATKHDLQRCYSNNSYSNLPIT